MDLSTTIASTAIVLAVLTAGYAFGEAASEPTQEQTIEAREVQRKTAYEGDCETPNKTEEEQLACRDAVRPLETGL